MALSSNAADVCADENSYTTLLKLEAEDPKRQKNNLNFYESETSTLSELTNQISSHNSELSSSRDNSLQNANFSSKILHPSAISCSPDTHTFTSATESDFRQSNPNYLDTELGINFGHSVDGAFIKEEDIDQQLRSSTPNENLDPLKFIDLSPNQSKSHGSYSSKDIFDEYNLQHQRDLKYIYGEGQMHKFKYGTSGFFDDPVNHQLDSVFEPNNFFPEQHLDHYFYRQPTQNNHSKKVNKSFVPKHRVPLQPLNQNNYFNNQHQNSNMSQPKMNQMQLNTNRHLNYPPVSIHRGNRSVSAPEINVPSIHGHTALKRQIGTIDLHAHATKQEKMHHSNSLENMRSHDFGQSKFQPKKALDPTSISKPSLLHFHNDQIIQRKKFSFNLKQLTHLISMRLRKYHVLNHDEMVKYVMCCANSAGGNTFTFDEKELCSLRRRIYDTINVMEATGLLKREKSSAQISMLNIYWIGFEPFWNVDAEIKSKMRNLYAEVTLLRKKQEMMTKILELLPKHQTNDNLNPSNIGIKNSDVNLVGIPAHLKISLVQKINESKNSKPDADQAADENLTLKTFVLSDKIQILYALLAVLHADKGMEGEEIFKLLYDESSP